MFETLRGIKSERSEEMFLSLVDTASSYNIRVLQQDYYDGIRLDSHLAFLAFKKGNIFKNTAIVFGEGYRSDEVLTTCTLSHELGHFFDILENYDGDDTKGYASLDILEREIRAWEYGFELLKKVDFGTVTEIKVFRDAMVESLMTYAFHGYKDLTGLRAREETIYSSVQTVLSSHKTR